MNKGIILAGGTGSRLAPLTDIFNKQLLPIYDKPMIYYPLSTLMLMGIRDILIITTEDDFSLFKKLLKDGSFLGINIKYKIQNKPAGIPQALLLSEEFINKKSVTLILGDNIFYGHDLIPQLKKGFKIKKGACIFGYRVNDPKRFGVAKLDKNYNIKELKEKPSNPDSNYAITGIYIYDKTAIEKAKQLKPSNRGELEITDLNNMYLKDKQLKIEILGRGIAWLDTGTFESLQEASAFIKTIENRQGLKVGCPEEIAWRMGWISNNQLIKIADNYAKSSYGNYLLKVMKID